MMDVCVRVRITANITVYIMPATLHWRRISARLDNDELIHLNGDY